MDSREHRRVQMRLPARLRWTTPLGQRIELVETIDVSRSSLLVSTKERHTPGIILWVTFPYDASLADGQPEIAARVARCQEVLEVIRATNAREKAQTKNASARERSAKLDQLARIPGIGEAPPTFAVAVQFERSAQAHANGNGDRHRGEFERRRNPRRTLAVPIRVRPRNILWFEEAMLIDYSAKSMRFRSHREYQPGDHLKIAFEDCTSAPWHGSREFLSEVVRVSAAPESIALEVSVRRVE